jgi:hypothetical protein
MAVTVITVMIIIQQCNYGHLSDFLKSDFLFHIHFSVVICDFLVKSVLQIWKWHELYICILNHLKPGEKLYSRNCRNYYIKMLHILYTSMKQYSSYIIQLMTLDEEMADMKLGKNLFCWLNCFYNVF